MSSDLGKRLLSASLIAPPVVWVLLSPYADVLVHILCIMNMYEYIKINCRQCPGSLLWKVVIITATAVRLTSLVPVRGGDGTYDFSYTFAEVNFNAAVLVVSLTTLVTLLPSSLSSQAFLPARTARTAALTALDFLTITLTYQAMLMIPTSSLKIYTAASAYMIDTAGLLVGRKLGGRFVDRGDWLRGVSPNKSWEGYAAGLVVSCLMASFFVPGVEVDRPGPEGESVVGCFSK